MRHVGFNVYNWGREHQNHLLGHGLLPLVEGLRGSGYLNHFWFTRFDARGPHVFAVLTTEDELASGVGARVEQHLSRYLRERPSREFIDKKTLRRRHDECRGKALCEVDREEGFAENNSVVAFPHPGNGYPMPLLRDLGGERTWRLLDTVVDWALRRLREGTQLQAALTWVATVDLALRRQGTEAAAVWRYHTTTLLMGLEERLESGELEIPTSLASAVGEKNRRLFERVWTRCEESAPSDIGETVRELVDHLVGSPVLSAKARHRALREVNHTTLVQLGLPVRAHVPMILHAWQENSPPKHASHR